MSFDLYFLSRGPGQSWDDAMDALEEAADDATPLDEDRLATWARIKDAVATVLPDAEEFEGETSRELSDEATGIQLSLAPGEVSLSVPYWHEGPEAERVTGLLRDIAARVEGITGLTAYDPQADAAFLGEGEHQAAGTLDRIHQSLPSIVEGHQAVPDDAGPVQRPSVWARLFGPKP